MRTSPSPPVTLTVLALAGWLVAAMPGRAAAGETPSTALADALALLADGELEAASDGLTALRDQAHARGDARSEGIVLWGLATARIEQGRAAEARDLAASSRERFESTGDEPWKKRADIWQQWAGALVEDPTLDTTLLHVGLLEELVDLEMNLFRFGDVVRHSDAALALLEGRGEDVAEAAFRMFRGIGLTVLQQLEPAETDLDASSAVLAEGLREQAPPGAPDLSLLADFLPKMILGAGTQNWEAALEHLEQMGDAYGDLLPPWMAEYFEMISLYREQRFAEAAALCDEIKADVAAALPEDRRQSAELLCRMGRLLADFDDEDATIKGFAELVPLFTAQLEDMPAAAQGPLGVLLGQFSSLVQNPDARDRWAAETNLEEPIEALEDSIAAAAPAGLRAGMYGALAPMTELFVSIKSGAGDAAAAFDLAEQMRARELLDRLADARVATRGATAAGERVASLRSRRRGLEAHLTEVRSRDPSAPEADEIRDELEGVRRELQAIFHRLALEEQEDERARTLSLEEIQATLGEDTTLVAFLTFASGTDDTLAWVVTRNDVHQVSLAVRTDELESEVTRFVQGIRRQQPVENLAESLYRRLWEPLRNLVHTRRVLLVPHGPLQALPFAALWDPRTGHRLVQDRTLLYAPSATVWSRLTARSPGGTSPPLVLGDPGGDLPAAAEEARAVACLWGVPAHLGREATEEALRSGARDASLLHVATHAVVSEEDPLFTYLKLAGSGGEADPRRDGRLELHEVVEGLDLGGTSLVVLPACRSADGPRTRGDEVTSLARAFLLAGARSVVTTAWAVDDDDAAALMVDFHRRLAAGTEAAEALRLAQEEALASPERAAPSHWAAFALHGAGGTVPRR
jgi:CHAT domain-containing protein